MTTFSSVIFLGMRGINLLRTWHYRYDIYLFIYCVMSNELLQSLYYNVNK